jgi:hypothetical protein
MPAAPLWSGRRHFHLMNKPNTARKPLRGRHLRLTSLLAAALPLLAACGPRARIPPRPVVVPAALLAGDSATLRAHTLAPTLYLQRDERFQLERVVAVIHPTRPIVAYHLLWRDDVHGAWIPFTKPTDQEIVWVGYDSTGATVEVWTFWHGDILHAPWRGGRAAEFDVQWGKHGSLPRGTPIDDLPLPRTQQFFYWATWFGLPDTILGRLQRRGPVCFCGSFARYLTFDRPLPLGDRIDAVVRTDDPHAALEAVFGRPWSRKRPWP